MKKIFAYVRGFTLLELIIVIGLISILLTISANLYSYSQKKSRDARRKTDLENIRIALESYRSNNNNYPPQNTITTSMADDCGNNGSLSDTNSTYLNKIPEDPLCRVYNYYYSLATDYTLCSYLEIGGTNVSGTDCSANATQRFCNYCLGPYGEK